jgi:hypothetical protein
MEIFSVLDEEKMLSGKMMRIRGGIELGQTRIYDLFEQSK